MVKRLLASCCSNAAFSRQPGHQQFGRGRGENKGKRKDQGSQGKFGHSSRLGSHREFKQHLLLQHCLVLPLQPELPLHQGCDEMPCRTREDWGASGLSDGIMGTGLESAEGSADYSPLANSWMLVLTVK